MRPSRLIAGLPIENGGKCIGSLVGYRSGGTTAGDKPIITVETDRKYRARHCGWTSRH